MLIMPELSLEVLYAPLGVVKLVRKLVRYVDCVVVVFFAHFGRPVK